METDIETIEHLDFDHILPCESTKLNLVTMDETPDCLSDGVAVWIVDRICCNDKRPRFGYFCDPCFQGKLNNPSGANCPVCWTKYDPTTSAWRSYRRIDDLT